MNVPAISRYSKTAITLHWIVAVLIVTNYALFLISDTLPEAQRSAERI